MFLNNRRFFISLSISLFSLTLTTYTLALTIPLTNHTLALALSLSPFLSLNRPSVSNFPPWPEAAKANFTCENKLNSFSPPSTLHSPKTQTPKKPNHVPQPPPVPSHPQERPPLLPRFLCP